VSGVRDVVVGPSAVEGLGLFAERPFASGERIRRIAVAREITPEHPLREDLGERADHCDYPDGRIVLLDFPDRCINHCCDPNAWVRYQVDAADFVARRAIAAGAEITIDYALNVTGGSSWPCHCGTARCRGTVAGDFFLLPLEIQREYRPLLARWFVRRHPERVAALDRALAARAP
jgi:hypothetical protein